MVIETPSRFYKDEIIKKFGSAIHEVAVSLGYKMTLIISAGEEIPRSEAPIYPEQLSELKAVLEKIGQFARSAGSHKASSALFTSGVEEEMVEVPKPKPTPNYVYKGNGGLGKLGFSSQSVEDHPVEDAVIIKPEEEKNHQRHAF